MGLSGFDNPDLKLILFGGKGGVGKTSCATATAIGLAETYKTLIISTDPAHSTSDSFDQSRKNGIHPVSGVENLSLIEINADDLYSEFKKENEEELKNFFETSTTLDAEDINDLLRLSIPGIDEVMSLKAIIDLIEEGGYDKYVVDTAPTGHALRLIASPTLLDQWVKVAAKMRWKYRYMVTRFSGAYTEDKTDALLLNLKKTVKKIERLFRDSRRCEFIPVCIPEAMAVLETERLISNLRGYNLLVRQIIMNNVMESEGCSFCRKRIIVQQKYLMQMNRNFPKLNKVIIPLFENDVKGLVELNQMKAFLFSQKR